MAVRWIVTGYDEDGNEIGYNYDDTTGEAWDDMGNSFDLTQENWYLRGPSVPDPNSVAGNIAQEQRNVESGAYGGAANIPTESAGWLASLANKYLGTKLNDADIAKLAIGAGALLGASGFGRATSQPVGYQGGIPALQATRSQIQGAIEQPGARAYGAGAAGRQYFTPTEYTKKAAAGGLMSLAEGGALEEGGFVIPADVVSHLGNGSSEAGLKLLADKMGATPIKGEGDGMSDSIKTSIDGERPARVANDEAYLSPDKVKAVGGAKKLYAMMDRIREARTGSKEQGKQIEPEKFVPGGPVQRFQTGGTTTPSAELTGTESNLSNWAGPYATGMLGQGAALANQPYQAYTGQLTAGTSPLSQQAYSQAQNFQTPQAMAQAANTLGTLAGTTQPAYQAGQFGNQFTAPTETAATQFTNQYKAPTPYQTGAFDAGTFGTAEAQRYMNPYLQAALEPQIAEARRQADITGLQDRAKLAQAGAYGGSRQAIMESEGNRNLLQNLANITGQGYNTAYTNAMAQFNADQARRQQAQQALEQSRQFGAQQAATAAQLQAQYGLSAQQAQEDARQFNQGQRMTAAQSAAQYGLAGQQAAEQSRQFGANLGLQGLQQQIAAAQAQGQLGLQSGQLGLQGIQQLGAFGAQQQQAEQAALDAQRRQFEEERDNPYKMVQFQQSLLQGLPLAAQNYAVAQTSPITEALKGSGTAAWLLKQLGFPIPG